MSIQAGTKNGFWKGGRSVASSGYVLIRVGKDHHLADVRGYAYEHRLVAEEKLGRRLVDGEIPHHINGDKADNRPENIEVVPSVAHHLVHHRRSERGLRLPDEPNPMVSCACGCGGQFLRYDGANRPRVFVSGHNPQSAPTLDRVAAALEYRRATPRSEIQSQLGLTKGVLSTALGRLVAKGRVRRVGRGRYELVEVSR